MATIICTVTLVHTLKFVNKDGSWHYVQVHLRKDGGFQTLDDKTAGQLAGSNPDYGNPIHV